MKDAPLLYIEGRNDGAGSTILNIIEAAAFSYHQGYNLGGTISCRYRVKHGFRIDYAVEYLLGTSELIHDGLIEYGINSLHYLNDTIKQIESEWLRQQSSMLESHHGFLLFSHSGRPSSLQSDGSQSSLEKLRPQEPLITPLDRAVPSMSIFTEDELNEWFDLKFVTELRKQASCPVIDTMLKVIDRQNERGVVEAGERVGNLNDVSPSTLSASSESDGEGNVDLIPSTRNCRSKGFALTVAMHVRRGDVTQRDSGRFDSDESYYLLAALLRKKHPCLDIHVFSSIEGGSWAVEDFNGYIQRNIQVHLDGDPLETWAQFLTCDLLVTSRSTFSGVASIYRRHSSHFCASLSIHSFIHNLLSPSSSLSLLSYEPPGENSKEDRDKSKSSENFFTASAPSQQLMMQLEESLSSDGPIQNKRQFEAFIDKAENLLIRVTSSLENKMIPRKKSNQFTIFQKELISIKSNQFNDFECSDELLSQYRIEQAEKKELKRRMKKEFKQKQKYVHHCPSSLLPFKA